MDLLTAMELAERGRSQAEADAEEWDDQAPLDLGFGERTNGNGHAPKWDERLEPAEGPFHNRTKMQKDCEAVLADSGSWLTEAYSVALHLRWLLRRLGLWTEQPA